MTQYSEAVEKYSMSISKRTSWNWRFTRHVTLFLNSPTVSLQPQFSRTLLTHIRRWICQMTASRILLFDAESRHNSALAPPRGDYRKADFQGTAPAEL